MTHCSLQGDPNKAKGAWPVGCQLGGEVLDILTSFKSFSLAPFSKTHLLKLYTWVNVMGWNKMPLKWIEWTFHPAPPHQHNTDKTTCNIKLPVVTLWFTFQPWQTAGLYSFNSCAYRITFLHMVLSLITFSLTSFHSLCLPGPPVDRGGWQNHPAQQDRWLERGQPSSLHWKAHTHTH